MKNFIFIGFVLNHMKRLVLLHRSSLCETLQIGNTNSRYKFPISARKFMNDWSKAGPSHHCAIGVGHVRSKIEKLAALLNIRVTVVC